MQWNLRLAAAQRGIWRSSDLRRLLAEAGLEISAGKMSHLWSGRPISVRLDDLDIICAVLGCEPGDLLIRDPAAAKARPGGTGGRRGRRLGDPAVAAGRPVAAAGMTAAAWPVITCTACGTTGPGPPQGRIVQTLLCPRPAPGPAMRQLRARTPAPGRRAVRPLLPAVADPAGHLPGLRPTAPGLFRRPVRAVQAAGRRQVRGLPGLREAGRAAVVGPLPQLRREVPRGHRRPAGTAGT